MSDRIVGNAASGPTAGWRVVPEEQGRLLTLIESVGVWSEPLVIEDVHAGGVPVAMDAHPLRSTYGMVLTAAAEAVRCWEQSGDRAPMAVAADLLALAGKVRVEMTR